jgi:hypothetical protein
MECRTRSGGGDAAPVSSCAVGRGPTFTTRTTHGSARRSRDIATTAIICDKVTGAIDPAVAKYWRDHYDLRYIMERDWATLGPKLRGKIHLTSGTMDNGYLNNSPEPFSDQSRLYLTGNCGGRLSGATL